MTVIEFDPPGCSTGRRCVLPVETDGVVMGFKQVTKFISDNQNQGEENEKEVHACSFIDQPAFRVR